MSKDGKKLTKAQQRVLRLMQDGYIFHEYIVPDSRTRFYRTLGKFVPGELVHQIDGKVIRYETFWNLFKRNMIAPQTYPWRQSAVLYSITEAGRKALEVSRG